MNNTSIRKRFFNIADEFFDGHCTIYKFTTNYRAAFGTVYQHEYQHKHLEAFPCWDGQLASGKTLEEAMFHAIIIFEEYCDGVVSVYQRHIYNMMKSREKQLFEEATEHLTEGLNDRQ